MKDKNPYKVPEGYFNSLQESILQRTVHSGIKPHKAVIMEHKPHQRNSAMRSMLGFAAGFAAFVCLAWGGFYAISGGDINSQESVLTTDEEFFWGGGNEAGLIDLILDDENYYDLLAEEVVEYIDFWGVGNTEIVFDFDE